MEFYTKSIPLKSKIVLNQKKGYDFPPHDYYADYFSPIEYSIDGEIRYYNLLKKRIEGFSFQGRLDNGDNDVATFTISEGFSPEDERAIQQIRKEIFQIRV